MYCSVVEGQQGFRLRLEATQLGMKWEPIFFKMLSHTSAEKMASYFFRLLLTSISYSILSWIDLPFISLVCTVWVQRSLSAILDRNWPPVEAASQLDQTVHISGLVQLDSISSYFTTCKTDD